MAEATEVAAGRPGTRGVAASPPGAVGVAASPPGAVGVAAGPSGAVGAAPRVGLLYDHRMCAHEMPDGIYHAENSDRLRAIWAKLAAEGVTSRCIVMQGKEASENSIAPVHTNRHVELIKSISSKSKSHRNRTARKFDSIYFNEGSSNSAFLAAGSMIEVTNKVAAGELNSAIALVRPPGHHAEHDKPMGFCLFNNVAIGATYLLNEWFDLGMKKILIIDWDAHHGNGIQKKFYNDPRVLYFSVHRYDDGEFFPYQKDASHSFIGEGAGKGYNRNVPWEHGDCGDADYIAVWNHILLPVAASFKPDIILLSAGFDAALGDPLGGCCITPNGYALLLTKLLDFANGKIVMALEGGYHPEALANSVCACIRVLLGDTFSFKPPEEKIYESTWRIIQTIRDELKNYWPVLSSKLPENVLLRSSPLDKQQRKGKRKGERKGKKVVPTAGIMQNPSPETILNAGSINGNEISQEQAIDAEQPVTENDHTERHESVSPAGIERSVQEIGLSKNASTAAENTQDTPDGEMRVKLIVPRTYQGASVLEGSDIHGFATADDLRDSINANDDCLTEGQVVGLLRNLPIFQVQSADFPDDEALRKGVVITISEDARENFPVTTQYTTVGKILKEHGPKILKIPGINIEKFEVKGNLWTRSRYSIDNTCYVYEWSTRHDKEHVAARRQRVSYADVIASNNKVVEAGADVVAASNRMVQSCDRVSAACTTLSDSINALATVVGQFHAKVLPIVED